MSKQTKTITVTIDNTVLKVDAGLTILQAAREHGIHIPSLCAHEKLSPLGGCRLCIVEIDGLRGFPTACTTPVADGMVVNTHTAQVQQTRREILQMILSEHTSSCLICDERVECKQFMPTIRKAGVTTGCRYCPNDDRCELQTLVEELKVEEIGHPVYYRGLRVEKEDPFYDRDYNLCIRCGRCIRACNEIRGANVLAFKQRGRHELVGPAFERTHMDSGCEFCGACVEVCPTGALAEKTNKWMGEAQRVQTTTCALCGVGCQLSLQIKQGEVIGALPADDPLVNQGLLCGKGRFCVPELVNAPERLRQPFKLEQGFRAELAWDEAAGLAAEKLKACKPERFGMLISTNCTNEDLYVAQKFARTAMGSNNIDTTARLYYGAGFNAYLDLMRKSAPMTELQRASVILCVGLDARFGRSVVGVQVRRAARRGAKIVTIHPQPHSFALDADVWLQPDAGKALQEIRALVKAIEKIKEAGKMPAPQSKRKARDQVTEAAAMLAEAKDPMILVGSECVRDPKSAKIMEAVGQLAKALDAGVLPLPAQNNLYGSLLMGAYPELLPGGLTAEDTKQAAIAKWNAETLAAGKKLDVLYLVGEVAPEGAARAKFVILQNAYSPEDLGVADLYLPSALFTEVDGTFTNGEGRTQRIFKAVDPPGDALPDWDILCRIARAMDAEGFDFENAAQIHGEIAGAVKHFDDFKCKNRNAAPLHCEAKLDVRAASAPSTSIDEHTFRGVPIASKVEGARKVFGGG